MANWAMHPGDNTPGLISTHIMTLRELICRVSILVSKYIQIYIHVYVKQLANGDRLLNLIPFSCLQSQLAVSNDLSIYASFLEASYC